MIVKRDRNECKPIREMSMPSMLIEPPANSMIRKSASVRLDFPAPEHKKFLNP